MAGRIKSDHTFYLGIISKLNIKAWMKFDLTYYDAIDQRVIHYFRQKWLNIKNRILSCS